jgi:hypothetical protein
MTEPVTRVETVSLPDVDDRALSTYLQRHLAGAGAARSIAAQLADETRDGPTLLFLERFRSDLEEEVALLRRLVERSGGGGSVLEWVSSFASGVIGSVVRTLPRPQLLEVELLEALAAGVWGKRLLWSVLTELSQGSEALIDRSSLAELISRADSHEKALVRLHEAAAVRSLGASDVGQEPAGSTADPGR